MQEKHILYGLRPGRSDLAGASPCRYSSQFVISELDNIQLTRLRWRDDSMPFSRRDNPKLVIEWDLYVHQAGELDVSY